MWACRSRFSSGSKACFWSIGLRKHGANRNLEKGVTNSGSTVFLVRSLIGWIIANAASLSTTYHVRNALDVAFFESVLQNPRKEIDRIYDALGISPEHQKRDEVQNCVRHAIGGNRSRFTRHSIESSPALESGMLCSATIALSRLLSKSGIV